MNNRKFKTESEAVSIKVCARFRPLNESEEQALAANKIEKIIHFYPNSIQIQDPINSLNFSFDHLFLPEASQAEVFSEIGLPAIEDIFSGYNSTIFAYGATGSGKTFTMMGSLYDDAQKGIIPRIADLVASTSVSSKKTISCIEIYREKIRDLINSNPDSLKLKETNEGIAIEGATKEAFENKEQLLGIFEAAEKLRSVAATRLNRYSSRSHFLMILEVVKGLENNGKLKGKLNLIDLAGSEKILKSEVSGINIEEAKKINLSLSALGKVICALSTNAKHIPYRDSKLTRLLQDSLGGNSKTTLVVNCSQLSCSTEETISSLRFAQRAKTIKNCLKVNKEVNIESELKSVKLELSKTQKELKRLKNHSLSELGQLIQNEDENYIKMLELEIMKNEKEIIQIECENKELRRTLKEKKENVNDSLVLWKLISLKAKNEKNINEHLAFKIFRLTDIVKSFKETHRKLEGRADQIEFFDIMLEGSSKPMLVERKKELINNPSPQELESLYIQAEQIEKKMKKIIKLLNWKLFATHSKSKIISQSCVNQQIELKELEKLIEKLRRHLRSIKDQGCYYTSSEKQNTKILQSKLDILKTQILLAKVQMQNESNSQKCVDKILKEIETQGNIINHDISKSENAKAEELHKENEKLDLEIENTGELLVKWICAVKDKQRDMGIDTEEIEEMLKGIKNLQG